MPAHRGLLVMITWIVICQNVSSYYEDNLSENDSEFEDLKGDLAIVANGNVENMAPNPNEDIANTMYPQNTRDLWFSKDDPQLLVQPLMNRKRSNLVSDFWLLLFRPFSQLCALCTLASPNLFTSHLLQADSLIPFLSLPARRKWKTTGVDLIEWKNIQFFHPLVMLPWSVSILLSTI